MGTTTAANSAHLTVVKAPSAAALPPVRMAVA
jgi:hypothetical protein